MSFNTQKHSRLKLSKLVLEIYFFVTKNFEDECCNAVRLSRSNLSILSKNIFSRTSLRILLSNTFAPLEEFSNLSIFISFFSLLFLLFFYFFFFIIIFFLPPSFYTDRSPTDATFRSLFQPKVHFFATNSRAIFGGGARTSFSV